MLCVFTVQGGERRTERERQEDEEEEGGSFMERVTRHMFPREICLYVSLSLGWAFRSGPFILAHYSFLLDSG